LTNEMTDRNVGSQNEGSTGARVPEANESKSL
jgi:hypothetical protein